MTLERYISYLENVRHLSAATIKAYSGDIADYVSFAATSGFDVTNPDKNAGRRYVAHLAKSGFDGRSVNRKISALRKFYAYKIRCGECTLNPFDYVRAQKTEKKLPVCMSSGELKKIDVLEEEKSGSDPLLGARDRALFRFLYSSGCRISEALSIKVHDVDFSSRQILITGKGGRQRYVFFGQNAADALAEYLPLRAAAVDKFKTECKALFIDGRGEALTPRGATWILRQYKLRAALDKNITLHTFRHTFATHILESGAPIRAVQELLGHAKLSTTQIYTHVGIGHLKDVHRAAHPHGKMTAQGGEDGI